MPPKEKSSKRKRDEDSASDSDEQPKKKSKKGRGKCNDCGKVKDETYCCDKCFEFYCTECSCTVKGVPMCNDCTKERKLKADKEFNPRDRCDSCETIKEDTLACTKCELPFCKKCLFFVKGKVYCDNCRRSLEFDQLLTAPGSDEEEVETKKPKESKPSKTETKSETKRVETKETKREVCKKCKNESKEHGDECNVCHKAVCNHCAFVVSKPREAQVLECDDCYKKHAVECECGDYHEKGDKCENRKDFTFASSVPLDGKVSIPKNDPRAWETAFFVAQNFRKIAGVTQEQAAKVLGHFTKLAYDGATINESVWLSLQESSSPFEVLQQFAQQMVANDRKDPLLKHIAIGSGYKTSNAPTGADDEEEDEEGSE